MQCFLRALEVPGDAIGPRRALVLTGIPVSAQAMWDAVKPRAPGRVRFAPDARVQEIMDAAPKATRSERAARLGFPHSSSIEEIVDDYQEDAALKNHG